MRGASAGRDGDGVVTLVGIAMIDVVATTMPTSNVARTQRNENVRRSYGSVLLLRAIAARDIHVAVALFVADPHLPRTTADLAIMDVRAHDVRLEGQLDQFATVWARDGELGLNVVRHSSHHRADLPGGELGLAEPKGFALRALA